MDTPGTPHAAAHCALHLQAHAVRACNRCGAFMCATCAAGDPPTLCPGCRARSASTFPLRRDSWTFNALYDRCVQAFKVDWLMLSLAMLIFLGVNFAAGMLGQVGVLAGTALDNQAVVIVSMIVGQLLAFFAQGLAQLGLFRICIDVLEGRRADLARFFSQAHKAPRYFLLMLLFFGVTLAVASVAAALGFGTYLATGSEGAGFAVGFALGFPAVLYVSIPLYFAPVELALEDLGPVEPLRRAWVVVSGFRLWVLLLLLVGVSIVFAGLCACLVGALPAYAFMHLLLTAFYLALRRGSAVQPE